jgi:NADH-quinone oxidoreductase subunit F
LLINQYVLSNDPCPDFALAHIREGTFIPDLPRFDHENRFLLRRCGYIDPTNINHYIATGGFSGLAKAIKMLPEDIIASVKESGLRGLGGAGFPTGRKWESCRNAPAKPKYVVCNADEGDPGAFMDRIILESDPCQIIEGMSIAGYAVGSSYGYIYVRYEYPLAAQRLAIALEQAGNLGLLGNNILDSGFSFNIKLVLGAGAFVCGEASALMYSIEGKRGMPRARPPHSVEAGLYGKPTVLNNVKTFASVPLIVGDVAGAKEKNRRTAVFTLAGKVLNKGLTEVTLGTTLRQLIFDIGGGSSTGKQIKAIQIGGPSGGCLPASLLDMHLDFDSLTSIGAMMGSGGLIVMDDEDCVVDIARFFLNFTQLESCGKCTMCRLGIKQMLDILEDIVNGRAKLDDLDLLVELGDAIKIGSLCGLGQSAPNPVITSIRYFKDEYKSHILLNRCHALVCPQLIIYHILPQKCSSFCNFCIAACPTKGIITHEKGFRFIDQSKCTKCGTCAEVCPSQYNAVVKLSPAKVPLFPR